jgi:hypothetical protein
LESQIVSAQALQVEATNVLFSTTSHNQTSLVKTPIS